MKTRNHLQLFTWKPAMKKFFSIVLILLIFVVRTAFAAISFDASAHPQTLSVATTHSWNHTCASDVTLLIVNVGNQGGFTVKYNGVPMTLIQQTSDGRWAQYYMVNPPSGTHTVEVTGNNDYFWGGSMSFKGTRTDASVIGAKVKATENQNGITSISKTLTTTSANSIIVDAWYNNSYNGCDSPGTMTPTATNQIQEYADTPLPQGQSYGSYMAATTISSYTPGWSWTSSTNGVNYLVVEIVASAPPKNNAIFFGTEF